MWMSVVTTRMTFVDPAAIGPMMDAIADGWQHGRTARTLAFEPWEQMLDRDLGEVRAEYGIDTAARPGTVFMVT
jgi:ubiquinone biosynthesis protein Coq4